MLKRLFQCSLSSARPAAFANDAVAICPKSFLSPLSYVAPKWKAISRHAAECVEMNELTNNKRYENRKNQ